MFSSTLNRHGFFLDEEFSHFIGIDSITERLIMLLRYWVELFLSDRQGQTFGFLLSEKQRAISPTQIDMDDLERSWHALRILFYLTGKDSLIHTWQIWILLILPGRNGFAWSYLTGFDSLDPTWKKWDSPNPTWKAWICLIIPDMLGFSWSYLRGMDSPNPTWQA